MVSLKTSVACVLLACLAHQVCLSAGAREKGRAGKTVGDSVMEPVPVQGSSRADRGMRSTVPKGKFSTKNNMQCTWVSTKEGTEVKLRVTCKNSEAARAREGVIAMKSCEYTGHPASCPGYGSNTAGFWKQVARALKKMHDKLCEDDNALVKAGMCKRAPKDAHFKLGRWAPRPVHTTTTTTTTTTTKHVGEPVDSTHASGQKCTERVDKQKLGEEYCSSAWASVCSFFFSVLDSTEC